MEILTYFIYLLSGAWFVFYVSCSLFVIFCTNLTMNVTWQALVISAVLGCASIAFYLGG